MVFQSAPVITDGRSAVLMSMIVKVRGFNPHPSSLTGDPSLTLSTTAFSALFQSAPVITDGRSDRSKFTFAVHGLFQSAPVITDGRSLPLTLRPSLPACFNPHPSSLTGDPRQIHTPTPVFCMFQSSPVITDGRSTVKILTKSGNTCFNPHPSSLTGDPLGTSLNC